MMASGPNKPDLREEQVIRLHRPGLVEKLFFLISGAIMSVPFTLLVESLANNLVSSGMSETFFAQVLSIAIIAPFVEEFAKVYPLFYRHGETERSIFILGFLVGLGFGIVEFLLYIFVYGADIIPRLLPLIFHATNASIVAYGIATRRTIQFYLIAVFLHFLNNLSAIAGTFWSLGIIVANFASYYLSWGLYYKTSDMRFSKGQSSPG
jgi:RsiW-degrading membrane proteinase PrsW (M82 family)